MPERSEGKALQFVPYEERVATVVGGGELGSRVAACYLVIRKLVLKM